MSYHRFNKQELLQKSKENYDNSVKKTAKHYRGNKHVMKEKENNKYKNLSEEEKEVKRQYSKNRYSKMKEKSKVIKMSYYLFNRDKLLKYALDKYYNKGGRQKAAKDYAAHQELLREDARNKYRNLSEKENNKK